MGKSIAQSVGAIIGLGLFVAACSGTNNGSATAEGGGAASAGSAGSAGSPAAAGSAGSTSACIAGAKRCDGLNVKLCDAAGAQETIAQTCLPSQSCSNGVCSGPSCVPNTASCKDGAVWECDASGNNMFDQQCAAGLFCRVDGDTASCSTQACSANQPVCNGNVATTCQSDGSGPNSGGMDCGNTKQACYSGQCRDIACSAGSKVCQHGDVYLCAHNGTDIALLAACNTGEVCDSDLGSCRAQLCDPGKVSCDGTRVQTCNSFGSAWLAGATDCAADGEICVDGSCKKQICGPNLSYCQDGSVYSCDDSGSIATITQVCDTQSQHCTTYNGGTYAYCQANDCHSGDIVCADNVIKVCNADGTLPASGTPCGDTQICDNGQCKDRVCTPGALFCKDSDVYYCDFSGSYSMSQQCTAGTECQALGTNATCAPLACTPSTSACLGNQIGTCAADGQSLSQVTTDCTTSTSVCTPDLKCAQSVTDTIGAAESAEAISAGSMVGDVIDVYSARKLTELQMQLVLASPRQLRWIVYELTGQSFVAKIDQVVPSVTGTGFTSSGPLSFELTAGNRYLLGVVISGGDCVDYIDSQPFSGNASFGGVVGRAVSYYPGNIDQYSIDTNYLSQMKMTTEAP